MIKWLIRLLLKPLIKPIKKTVELADKVTAELDRLIVNINGLPIDQSYKDGLLRDVSAVSGAIATVRTVLVKLLETAGETIPGTNNDTIAQTIDIIKKAL